MGTHEATSRFRVGMLWLLVVVVPIGLVGDVIDLVRGVHHELVHWVVACFALLGFLTAASELIARRRRAGALRRRPPSFGGLHGGDRPGG